VTKLVAKLRTNAAAYNAKIAGTLYLPFAERRLARGEPVRGGELATADDGKIYRIEAQPERVLEVRCAQPRHAAVIGYLLGSGHVAVQFGEASVRAAYLPELEELAAKLGLEAAVLEAPFEPELGAEAPHQHHHHHHHHHHDHDHGHGH